MTKIGSNDQYGVVNPEDVVPSINPLAGLAIPTVTADIGATSDVWAPSDAIASTTASAADHPALSQPRLDLNGDAFIMNLADAKNQIINQQLDAWTKSLQIQKEIVERRLNSPQYLAEQALTSPQHLAQMAAQNPTAASPTERAEQLRNVPQQVAFLDGINNYLSGYRDRLAAGSPEAIAFSPVVAVAMPIGLTSALGASMAVHAIPQITAAGATVFQDVWANVMPYVNDNANAILGLFGAMFTVATVYPGPALAGVAGANEQAKDLNFAIAFAKKLLSVLNPEKSKSSDGQIADNEFDRLVKSLLGGAGKDGMVATLKVALLAAALAMVYKAETGNITGQEFQDMVFPNSEKERIILPKGDVRHELIAMIVSLLPRTGIESQLKSALTQYMNSKPNFDSLRTPGRVLEGLFAHFSSNATPV